MENTVVAMHTMGGLLFETIVARKEAAQKELLLRGAETRRRRKADRA